jgi:hypothetical protein
MTDSGVLIAESDTVRPAGGGGAFSCVAQAAASRSEPMTKVRRMGSSWLG